MLDRRAFLKSAAALGIAVPMPFPWPVPSEPYADQSIGLGIQLYTLRSLMARDFEGTLATVAEIGYREVEFAGYFNRSPAQVRDALANAGLTAPATHISYELATGDAWGATLEAAATIGHDALIVPSLPGSLRASLDGFRRVADGLSRAGERAAAAGLRFGYHNHDFEFAPMDGRVPFDVLLEASDPDHVLIELDVFWATKGGADPIAYLNRQPGRVRWIHAKDMDASGAMVDIGAGRIDFAAIIRAGGAAGLEHVFVEHDTPADPLDTARAGYERLKALVE